MTISYHSGERIQGINDIITNNPATESAYSYTAGSENSSSVHSGYKYGQKLDSGHSGIGKAIHKVQIRVKKVGSPTGNAQFEVIDPDGSTVVGTGDVDISTFGTSYALVEVTLDNYVTLEADSRVVLHYSGGDSSNYAMVGVGDVNGAGSNTSSTSNNGSSWVSPTTRDSHLIFDSTPASASTTTTTEMPTDVPGYTRFEATDTRKMYSKEPNYKVHSFTSSGTFQITSGSGNTEVLVIAGGGGGAGNDAGGGGGAGGYSEKASHPVTASSYTVTVGAGGLAGGANPYLDVGTKGGDSSFDSIISDGGGAGVNGTVTTLMNGGSGGGVRNNSPAGTATQGDTNGATGYGNAGADTGSSSTWGGGGGGGASAAGTGASGSGSSGTYGGVGGNGKSNSITGTAVIYAGGGGGGGRPNSNSGAGGTGGGGTAKGAGTDGLGGGGGGGQSGLGGDGGSGIVIIKYADDGSITATGGTVTTISGTWKEKGTT